MALQTQRIIVKGIVQGVGFRPFIFKIAQNYSIKGWIYNDSGGVTIEAQSSNANLDLFLDELVNNPPKLAFITNVNTEARREIDEVFSCFEIRKSKSLKQKTTLISPDTYVCDDCLKELFDPSNRRYKYPFINCTNCGPRYSIIFDLPYDRPFTTMSNFKMCKDCNAEYTNPDDRRYHAQPIACEKCGPVVSLFDKEKNIVNGDPISKAVELLKAGNILCVKGLGGYHLIVDPTNHEAVQELRKRKKRNFKPFALMSESTKNIKKFAKVNKSQQKALESISRPIVLLLKKNINGLSDLISPNNNYFGFMLSYTPLHYLLLKGNFDSLVCTSANVSGEPLIHREQEAFSTLNSIADYYLIHNREIYTRVDDSIVKVDGENDVVQVIRRGRGYTPLPIIGPTSGINGLAVGSELKNTICLGRNEEYFLSQHIGDLKNRKTYEHFKQTIEHLENILDIKPKFIVSDLHESFFSTKYAKQRSAQMPLIQVQHHHAHMASCMVDNQLNEDVIGVIFDGTGLGTDSTLWGGEFLIGNYANFTRLGHFQNFVLIGGDQAVKQPYRLMYSVLDDIISDKKELKKYFDNVLHTEISILSKMKQKNLQCFSTSSVGRIFDLVSTLLGICSDVEYEGQAAIELEQVAMKGNDAPITLPYTIDVEKKVDIVNFYPIIEELIHLRKKGRSLENLSLDFHFTLAEIISDMCQRIRSKTNINKVVLSGGVFLNSLLSSFAKSRLENKGFEVFSHSKIPTNDGGISVGQLAIGTSYINERKGSSI